MRPVTEKVSHKVGWSILSGIIAAGLVVGGFYLIKTVTAGNQASRQTSQSGQSTDYVHSTACDISFPVIVQPTGKTSYWKLDDNKNTAANPAPISALFPHEAGYLYGDHGHNGPNTAAVDVQCSLVANQNLSTLTQQYEQALRQIHPNQTVIRHNQTITKWGYPTRQLSLPNNDPKLPDDTVYLVVTPKSGYLIQAVSVSGTPNSIVSQTATILDKLKFD